MNAYMILTFIAVLETFALILQHNTKMSSNQLMFFVAGIVACFGYGLLSGHNELEICVIGLEIYHIGITFSSIFLVQTVSEICDARLPKFITIIMSVLSITVAAHVFLVGTGVASSYYSAADIAQYKNLYYLKNSRGFMHIWTDFITCGSGIMSIAVICNSIRMKKRIALMIANLLVVVDVITIFMYFLPYITGFQLAILPFAYVVDMAALLIIFSRAEMYDMADNLLKASTERETEYGYLCIDNRMRFLGCTDFISHVIPELCDLKLNSTMRKEDFREQMLKDIIDWTEGWIKGVPGARQSVQFNKGGKYWDATIRPIKQGRTKGFLVDFHDDTVDMTHINEVEKQREIAEAARREAEEANAAKSAFLSVVTHEIRTPMNAVVGMTELLLRERENLTEKQINYLTNISNSGASVVLIANDILDQSRLKAGTMEILPAPYDLKGLSKDIKLIIEDRVGTKPIEVQLNVDDGIPDLIVGDGLRVRQILINLMNNAAKFTLEGYIRLTIKVAEITEDYIDMDFSVEDSGQGIRAEDMDRLGKAFTRLNMEQNHSIEGTGLGLAIVYKLLNLMGTEIKVASEYGKGTRFNFTLRQEILKEEPVKEEELAFTIPEARVLIVDDAEINQMIAIEVLKPLNMQIETALSGAEAIEKIENGRYDLVLMDYMMPLMDGIVTTGILRDKVIEYSDSDPDKALYLETLPIIALSGDNTMETQEQFAKAGITDFTAKPVEFEKLAKIIRKYLPQELIVEEKSE